MPDEPDLSVPRTSITYTVTPEEDGLRLDQFLSRRLHWRSRASIQDLIAAGDRIVGWEPKRATTLRKSYRLQAGDRISISLPEPAEAIRHDDIPLCKLYEDRSLLALNKQPGIIVHPVGRHQVNTLMNVLHHHYRDPDPAKDIVPRLCHRLDRDTSGIILVALTEAARRTLQADFEARAVEKSYLALVEGRWPHPGPLDIELPLDPDPRFQGRLRMIVAAKGSLPSSTTVVVEEAFDGFTLLRMSPHTGRQHQLRVHAAGMGHPIVCDPIYGSDFTEFPRGMAPPLLTRQALHAASIRFRHPETGEGMELDAPLPGDFRTVLEYLRT